MKLLKFKTLLLIVSIVLGSSTINGQTLAGWDFSTQAGGAGNFGTSPLAATTSVANASIGSLTRGSGFGTLSGAGVVGAWGSTNYTVSGTLAGEITANKFFSFTISPNVGFKVSLLGISAYNIRRSNTGPTTGQWQYQIGSGTFQNIGTAITWGTNTTSTGNAQLAIDLSALADLQNVTSTITIRLVNYGATGSGGTCYIKDLGNTTSNDLVVNGIVSSAYVAPSISSFSPTSGATGSTVTITGSNFTGGTAVSIGGTAVTSFVVNSDTQITAVVASGSTGAISVMNSYGLVCNSSGTFTYIPAPTITSFTPTNGCNGSSITISGTGFNGATAVSFGGTAASSFIVNSDTQISAVYGSGSTGNIAVTTPGGSVSSNTNFTEGAAITSYAYVSNQGNNTVSVINTATSTVTATVNVGNTPSGVCISPDGKKVYVSNGGSNTVSVINTATNTVTSTIAVGTSPYGICISPDGSKVYVANEMSSNVSVINTVTNTVSATVSAGSHPNGISISPDGSKVYVVNWGNNNVNVINTATNTVTATITVGNGPFGVCVSPDGSKAYVTNRNSNNVSVINIATNTVTATVAVGTFPFGISVSPDGSKVYVANQSSNTVSVISTTINTVTATVAVGTNPFGTSVSPDGTKVYVSNINSNNVSVINAGSNTVTSTVAIGTHPYSFGNLIGDVVSECIPLPTITSFTPTSGGAGTIVTITGTNLIAGGTLVNIGGASTMSNNVVNATTVTAVVVSGATGTISVTTTGGKAVSSDTFTFIPAPIITGFTPTNGSNGNTVVITGTNLSTTTAVSIGGTAATSFTVNSDTQVTATIGTGKTGTISLTTLGGTATSTGTFTYNIVSTAGGLAAAITAAGYNLSTMTNLTFTGTIDARDFKTMRDDMPLLAVLDMSGATISAYTGTLGTGGTGSIVYPANEIPQNAFFNSSYVGKVSLISVAMPTSVTSIGIAAFTGCSGLTGSLTIPTSVTNIGSNAFFGCSGLTGNLTIGNSVITIGDFAFAYCSGLTGSLTIPNSISNIGNEAFSNCSGLTGNLIIGNGVTIIGNKAFASCSGLTGNLSMPNLVTTIGHYAFTGCSGLTGNLTIGNSVTTIGDYAFAYCSGLTGSLTIPNFVTNIGAMAFYKCSGFKGSLTIGNALTIIGEGAFFDCSGLVGSLTIPNLATTIGANAFYGCNGLTGSIIIGSSVTNIGTGAFYFCSNITSVSIPSSVSVIGSNAFVNCTNLGSIYAHPITPINLTNSAIVFSGVNKTTCKLHVPSGSGSLYAAANQWMDFTNISEGFITPTVTTEAVSTITGTTATGNGTITNLGDVNPTQYGVVWSTSTNPDISLSTKTTQGAKSATGAFTSAITGLSPNTQYYVKAYATNGAGTSYGSEVTFTTLPAPTITSFTPTNGCTGTTVTITGTDFTGATAVSFGGTPATSFTVVNPTTITAVFGNVTTGKITVTTAGGSVNSTTSFIEGSSYVTYAYIASSGSNSVRVINTITNALTATVTVGTYPYGVSVSPDGSKVYVTNWKSNTVSVINTATNAVIATITVGNGPEGISVSPDCSRVYVTNNGSNTVSVINTATNAVTATVAVGSAPSGVSISPDGSKVYVANANSSSNNVSVINTATNSVVATVVVGTNPDQLSVSPDGSKVYVVNAGNDNSVSVINTATNSVTATVAVGIYPQGVCISPDGSKVYVANHNSTTVSVINTATNTVTSTVLVGTFSSGISVSPDGNKVYVVDSQRDIVNIINTTTNTVTSTIPIGSLSYSLGNFIANVVTPCIPAPTITSFTPTSGGIGATVTITGTDLTGASAVSIGGTSASSVTVVNATTVTAVVGSGTTGTISLTTPGGTAVSSGTFSFVPAPTITSFTPTTSGVGAIVTISGTNLTGTSAVSIGGTSASSVTVVDANTVTAIVGNGTTGTISITTPGGTAVSADTYNFIPAPTISSFTPTNGGTGNTVIISGTNLLTTTGVSIGFTLASSFIVNSDTQITATLGSGATGAIGVNTLGGTAISSGIFTFTPAPTITSFSPTSGLIGSSVTITGTGFNAIAAQNIVYFGGAKATVTSATATSLNVTVPNGSTYEPISVTSSISGLTAYSAKAFDVSFISSGIIDSNSFDSKVDFATGVQPYGIVSADLDLDGKSDLVIPNTNSSNTVSVLRNNATVGSINSSSLNSNVTFTSGNNVGSARLADIDGDGKKDIIESNYSDNTFSVLLNTSSPGSVTSSSFATRVSFTTGSNPVGIAVNDIDMDGKPDVIVVNCQGDNISVFRNTSTLGNISFAPKVDFPIGGQSFYVMLRDLDGDGKPEMIVNVSGSFKIFRNISTQGIIDSSSFASETFISIGGSPRDFDVADIDGDGKVDILVPNQKSANFSVFKNLSTSGNILFNSAVNFASVTSPVSAKIGDIDGDGKPDVVIVGSNNAQVFKNTSTSGNISFNSGISYAVGNAPMNSAIVDIDGDGKPEICVANFSDNNISILRNKISNAPTISSFTPTTGALVTITGTNLSTATTVSIGGTAVSSFTVISDTQISAVAATGSNGTISVTTPGGTARSAGTFTVSGVNYFVTVPEGTNACYISGSMNGWTFTALTKIDATHYTVNIPTATLSDTYKYCSGSIWAYEETDISGNLIADRTYHASDVVVRWLNIYDPAINPTSMTYTVAVPVGTQTCYISGDWDNYVQFIAMTRVDATHYTVTIPSLPIYRYKYLSGTDWAYEELDANNSSNFHRVYSASDVVVKWKSVFTPAPTITSFTPTSGGESCAITITGTHLTGATAVSVGGIPVYSFGNYSDTQLGANVGTGATGTVSITTPGGTVVSSDTFTFIPLPVISSFSPISGPTGTKVTIKGKNFTGATFVGIGTSNMNLQYTVESDTIITFYSGSTSGNIRIDTPGGIGGGDVFTTLWPPTISWVTPNIGGSGTTITINGTNLIGTSSVTIGGTAVSSFTVVDKTAIIATVGNGATGTISVTTPDGTATSGDTFTFIPAPIISSFSPIFGPTGTEITIKGKYLTGTSFVSFGSPDMGLPFTVISDTTITVNSGLSSGTIFLRTPGGSTIAGSMFTITYPPTITWFTPSTGGNGTTITIYGTNFNGTSSVSIGATAASSFTVVDNTTITATVANGSTGTISVTNQDGTATSGDTFTYVPVPIISSFSPTSGMTGTEITLKGKHLTGTSFVTIGNSDMSLPFTVTSDTTITLYSGGISGNIRLTTPGGVTSIGDIFTIIVPPTITGFNPSTGTTGSTVYITGYYLTGTTAVSIGGTSASSVTVVDANNVTAIVGNGTTGTISITNPAGTATSSDTFTYIPPVSGVTYSVTVPIGTNACYVAGTMNGWTFTAMNKVDDTHYTLNIPSATVNDTYKYCSGPGWGYQEKDANGYDISDRNYAANDVVAKWAIVYSPAIVPVNVVYTVTVPSGTNTCYINGAATNWQFTAMTKLDDTHYAITINTATPNSYQYCSGADWTYRELDINNNRIADRNYAINDVVIKWASVFAPVYGSNYTITFSGSGATSSAGDVLVENLTQGTSVTVPLGNKLYLYDTMATQTDQPGMENDNIVIYPNGTLGNNILSFYSKQAGNTQVNVYGIDGRMVVDINQQLQVGQNSFRLSLKKGAYIVQVIGSGYSYSTKMLNPNGTDINSSIEYSGNEKRTEIIPQKIKSDAGITSMLYYAHDQLLFKAVSGNYSTIIPDIPYENKNVNFNFIACQDADGNNYSVVTIGSQTWMAENLKTTKYRTGDNVPNVTDDTNWSVLFSGAWCDNANNPLIGARFGHFYNFASVYDPRNIAPVGWHVATDNEWSTLSMYLGGENVAGGKLKETGTTNWTYPNAGSTNESGFTALAAGGRSYDGTFGQPGYGSGWWSSTPIDMTTAWGWKVVFNDATMLKYPTPMSIGVSVRCVKDAVANLQTIPTLSTETVTAITANTASSGGNISSDGGAAVTARGICWSTSPAPDITLTTKTSDNNGIGAFSSSITGLSANATYYVRAYATNSVGTAYGNEISFTTHAAQLFSTVTDIDGNVYHEVTIGTQTWMVENLKTTKYRNGDAIPYVADNATWSALTSGAQAAYNNDAANATKYGLLYNWYAVADSRNIAPTGWHVPTDAEWTTLENYLIANGYNFDGRTTYNNIAKSLAATTDWYTSTGIGNIGNDLTQNNTSGFSALPGGYRYLNGQFYYLLSFSNWWSSSASSATTAWYRNLASYEASSYYSTEGKANGFSVRCIKDAVTASLPTLTTSSIISLSSTSASSGGNLTSDGGSVVTERGIVWSTTINPVIDGIGVFKSMSGASGTGSFTCSMDALIFGQTYYVRAYATNSVGTAYGNEVMCTISMPHSPVISTADITLITNNSATSGGNVVSDGFPVMGRGICWSTSPSPTIYDSHTSDGTGIGAYLSSLTGLTAGTTYYVRAFVISDKSGYGINNPADAVDYGNVVSFTTSIPITDIDGNVYKTVIIGTQTWMVENLKTTKYRNGENIANVTDNTAWAALSTGAWCDYSNSVANGTKYGHLYNWYAVADSRNIAPTGWHVPSDAEWTTLTNYLGGESVAGGKLKEAGTLNWQTPNTAATNSTGFSALPGGCRNDYAVGAIYMLTSVGHGYWWTSSQSSATTAWNISMHFDISDVGRDNGMSKFVGCSVRCVKD